MLCNPHFMHQLFSFSLYNTRQTRDHFKKTNEYKAHRSINKHKKESVYLGNT
jgi:hypothetical protein